MDDAPKTPLGRPWGWLLVALGMAGLVVRYLAWPLGGSTATTALTGGSIGLVMGGLQVEKQRRAARGEPPRSALVTVAMVALSAALSLGAALLRPTLAEALSPPVTHELPGLQVTTPGWRVSEQGRAFEMGKLVLEDPDGRGGFLEVNWSASDPMTGDDLATMWTTQLGFNIAGRSAARASGHDATLLELASPDGSRRSLMTGWSCPEHERMLYVLTSRGRPRDETLALHEEVVRSVACHRPVSGGVPRRVFPAFDAPPGSADTTTVNGRVVASDVDIYGFMPGVPRPALLDDLTSKPEVVRLSLASGLGASDVQLGAREERRGADGWPRAVWTGRAVLDGAPVAVALVAWTRASDGRTFIAYHATARADAGPGVEALLSAR
jgi:hypothetical protein